MRWDLGRRLERIERIGSWRAWLGVRGDDLREMGKGKLISRHRQRRRRRKELGFRRNHHLARRDRARVVLLSVGEDGATGEEGKK